jgi:hypothetical protein
MAPPVHGRDAGKILAGWAPQWWRGRFEPFGFLPVYVLRW